MILTEQFAGMLLASMTGLAAPGNTIFSQVPISKCDATCQETNYCENQNNWKCKKPQFSQELFDLYQDKEKSFTRPETYEEGLVRYSIIAEVESNVSKKFTTDVCITKCTTDSCKELCESDYAKQYKRLELAMLSLVAINQESGFRSDVHGGVGAYGRGDCQWKLADGTDAKPFQKHAKPVKSTCKSVCLGQIKIGRGSTEQGWTADDLVGIDYASTEHCLTVVAQYMLRAEELCYKRYRNDPGWYKSIFSAYGSGTSCLLYQSRVRSVEDRQIKEFAYMTPGGVFWSPLPPDDSLSKEPLEELWPAKRANIFGRFIGGNLKPSKDMLNSINTVTSNKLYNILLSSERLYWAPGVDFSVQGS